MGVSIAQLSLLQIVFSAAICTFEVPCGFLGDKIGVKKMLSYHVSFRSSSFYVFTRLIFLS